jgi:lyso-ornithine lipid O-acyltransferase
MRKKEKVLIWLNKSFHFVWTAVNLGAFFLRAGVIRILARNPLKRRLLNIKNNTLTSRNFLKIFHIKLQVKNREHLEQLRGQNYLVVGNHASYLDIFMLAAQENYVFISSVEMSETPVLGEITRAGGCVFTDRKKVVSLPQEIARFAEIIRSGFKVVLFPEQSGTDGSDVREFRKSLFQVAVEASCTVLPVCIRYKRLDGKPVNDENRQVICWYRGIRFVQHLWNLLARRLEAEISFLDPIMYDPERKRGELSDLVYNEVNASFNGYDTQLN